MKLKLKDGTLDLSGPVVMGILNVTPDSFSDGGRFVGLEDALRQAERMVVEGAAIIDVGGESTRPGAEEVGEQAEIERVGPVIEAVAARFEVLVSVDTSKAGVMREAVALGAGMVNDVYALRREGAAAEAAKLGVPVCLMHMQGEPRTMQENPAYDDVTAEVIAFLQKRVAACEAAGLSRDSIVVDPGFGFGKTAAHNLQLLADLGKLAGLGLPVLVGLSRKRTLGSLTGRGVDERMPAGLAAAVLAVAHGAHIVRTHDVGPTVDALKVATAVMEYV